MTQPKPTPDQFAVGGQSGQVLTHSGAATVWTTVSSSSSSVTKTTASRTAGNTAVTLTVPAGEDVVCISVDVGQGTRVSVSGFDSTINTADRTFRNHYDSGLGPFTGENPGPFLYGVLNYYVFVSYTAATRTVSIELKSVQVSASVATPGQTPVVTTLVNNAMAIEMWSSG